MKKLFLILVLYLVWSGSAYSFFEVVGKSTVKNVEECINNSSKLLDKTDNETRCVVKFQKKITRENIADGTANHSQDYWNIMLQATITNISQDVVITGIKINYEYSGTYEGNLGSITIPMVLNGDNKIDTYTRPEYLSNIWLQPGETETFNFTIQYYKSCPPGTSKKGMLCDQDKMIEGYQFPKEATVTFKDKNFKYEWNKLGKNWSWQISEIYGVFIK